MFKRIAQTLVNIGHKVATKITGHNHRDLVVLDDVEGNLPHSESSWIPRGNDETKVHDTSRYLHISKQPDSIIQFGDQQVRIRAPKGTTYNNGTNAAKRYVERLASNNKEKRMLRSRLKRRMAELAQQAAAA